MENVRILSFKKTADLPTQVWATVELILKHAGLKFHTHHVNNEPKEAEIIFRIDNKALCLDEILVIAQKLAESYKLDALCYDPGRTSLTNKKLYPEPACQMSLALEHK